MEQSVIENEKDTQQVEEFLALIRDIELSWQEAGVLLQHIYNGFDITGTADILNITEHEARTADRTLIRKVAVALGYIEY